MPARKPFVTPYSGIDLDFRPTSYCADHTPVAAVVQNITGTHRREVVALHMSPEAGALLGEVDEALLQDTVAPDVRIALGQMHPTFMGGEYLPDYHAGEQEIARVEVDTSTGDVLSLRARRTRTRYVYRLVDEYEASFDITPTTSRYPLTLREVIHLLDTASSDELWTSSGVVRCWPESRVENGEEPEDVLDGVEVSSEVYPMLGRYYRKALAAWAAELSEDEGDGEEEAAA